MKYELRGIAKWCAFDDKGQRCGRYATDALRINDTVHGYYCTEHGLKELRKLETVYGTTTE